MQGRQRFDSNLAIFIFTVRNPEKGKVEALGAGACG
jgi:hypothetical protein